MKTLDASLSAGIGPLEAMGFIWTKFFIFMIITLNCVLNGMAKYL